MLSQLTPEHVTSLINLANLIVTVILVPLVGWIITRQKKSEKTILNEGAQREVRITAKVQEGTTASKVALDAANGLTEKHTATVEIAKSAAELAQQALSRTTPQQVEVVNTEAHPVPTTTQP